MTDLDEKLREILAHWRVVTNTDDINEAVDFTESTLEQIKQAFKDSDWVDKKELKSWSYTAQLLTGREWYDRFEKELGDNTVRCSHSCFSVPNEGSSYSAELFEQSQIKIAAKKASGIE